MRCIQYPSSSQWQLKRLTCCLRAAERFMICCPPSVGGLQAHCTALCCIRAFFLVLQFAHRPLSRALTSARYVIPVMAGVLQPSLFCCCCCCFRRICWSMRRKSTAARREPGSRQRRRRRSWQRQQQQWQRGAQCSRTKQVLQLGALHPEPQCRCPVSLALLPNPLPFLTMVCLFSIRTEKASCMYACLVWSETAVQQYSGVFCVEYRSTTALPVCSRQKTGTGAHSGIAMSVRHDLCCCCTCRWSCRSKVLWKGSQGSSQAGQAQRQAQRAAGSRGGCGGQEVRAAAAERNGAVQQSHKRGEEQSPDAYAAAGHDSKGGPEDSTEGSHRCVSAGWASTTPGSTLSITAVFTIAASSPASGKVASVQAAAACIMCVLPAMLHMERSSELALCFWQGQALHCACLSLRVLSGTGAAVLVWCRCQHQA